MEVLTSHKVADRGHSRIGRFVGTFGVGLLAANFLCAAEPEDTKNFEQPVQISELNTLLFTDDQSPSPDNNPPLPESALPPSPADKTVPLLNPSIPARKMTARRDPDPRRFIGNDVETGKSIRDVKAELDANAIDNPLMREPVYRSSMLPWCAEPPYGKYIFIPHEPLLFEDIPAERYGEQFHPCLQPVVSFTKFVGAVPMLPYKIKANHCAAKYEGVLFAADHHGNLRPGIYEGAYFPDYYLGAPYPKVRFIASLSEIATLAGIALFLP